MINPLLHDKSIKKNYTLTNSQFINVTYMIRANAQARRLVYNNTLII
jgi:hypothetical protein